MLKGSSAKREQRYWKVEGRGTRRGINEVILQENFSKLKSVHF